MPADQKQWDTALLSSDCQDHWPSFSNARTTLRQELNNIVDPDDKVRILAYRLWMDMYRNRPENFKVVLRGEDEDSVEIYLPSARKMIEATHRFLAVGFRAAVSEDVGTTNDQEFVKKQLERLFKRERFNAKFATQKRYCLIKGDAVWHLVGDPTKRKGHRLSLRELPPENYFPIFDWSSDSRVGCHIVDIIKNPKATPAQRNCKDEYLCRRQTYRREKDSKGRFTGLITSTLDFFELGKWDDRNPENEIRLVTSVYAITLPPLITQLPVYHFRNNPPQNSPFGVSEIAGVELLIKALNQSLSDEDLTLVTQGLGVYFTDAPPPIDAEGNEVPYEIGPGAVVQTGPEGKFGRVSGVSSVGPYQEHMRFADEQAMAGVGVPDIAAGQVDVSVAESGIARLLKLGPLMAKNAEKELEILDVHDQMLYDIVHMWLPSYEGTPVFLNLDTMSGDEDQAVEVLSVVDDPMPKDRKAEIEELSTIFGLGVMPVDKLYAKLNDLGYEFEEGDFEQAVADNTLIAEAQAGGGLGATGDGTMGEDPMAGMEEPQGPDIFSQLPTKDLLAASGLNGNSPKGQG